MSRDADLLLDLAKLLRKYGPEAFESLADLVSSNEAMEKAARMLRSAGEIARTVPARWEKGRSKPRQPRDVGKADDRSLEGWARIIAGDRHDPEQDD